MSLDIQEFWTSFKSFQKISDNTSQDVMINLI
jgi:hypothetical protein